MSSPSSNTPSAASSPAHSVSGSLPPRKRARTDAEKEQRRVERILRNRKAAHASREKKRKHVENLESYVVSLEANLQELFKRQECLLEKLSDSKCDFDLIDMVQRPEGLVLSFEEERSLKNSNSNKNGQNGQNGNNKEKNSPNYSFQEPINKKQRVEIKKEENEEVVNVGLLNNDDLNLDILTPPCNDDLPLLSSYSSPSPPLSSGDASNPTTPLNGNDEMNLFTTESNMDFLNYLEPDFTTDSSTNDHDFENSNFKGLEVGSSMGNIGLFNSVHSAVMHTFRIIC